MKASNSAKRSPAAPAASGRRFGRQGKIWRWLLGLIVAVGAVAEIEWTVRSLYEVYWQTEKICSVDLALTKSLGEVRAQHVGQFALGDQLLRMAHEKGTRANHTWEATVKAYVEHGDAVRQSTSRALERAVAAQRDGMASDALISELYALETLHERLENDMQTLSRLVKEGRADDVPVTANSIADYRARTEGQLEAVRETAETSVFVSAGRLQSRGLQLAWIGSSLLFCLALVATWMFVVARRRKANAFPTLPAGAVPSFQFELSRELSPTS